MLHICFFSFVGGEDPEMETGTHDRKEIVTIIFYLFIYFHLLR